MSQRINQDILNFARGYCSITHEDPSSVYAEIVEARKIHLSGGTDKSSQKLLDKWKESDRTDYSVYGDRGYVVDAWLSWDVYSRQYIKKIESKATEIKDLVPGIKTFVDLGAGMGYSTLALHKIFSELQMTATQIPETWQWKFCEKLFKGTDINLCTNEELKSADAIFASEYFEHFDKPIEHLIELLEFKPKLLLVKSTFQQPDAVGHFEYYYDENNKQILGKDMNRAFNAYLRNHGYEQNPIRFFNSAPTVFVRK